MSMQLTQLDFKPFLITLFIFWAIFCILIMVRPKEWLRLQNRYLRQYGLKMEIIEDRKFFNLHRKAGFWLLVLGICLALIVYWYIIGILIV